MALTKEELEKKLKKYEKKDYTFLKLASFGFVLSCLLISGIIEALILGLLDTKLQGEFLKLRDWALLSPGIIIAALSSLFALIHKPELLQYIPFVNKIFKKQ
jgi:hypothetical protein